MENTCCEVPKEPVSPPYATAHDFSPSKKLLRHETLIRESIKVGTDNVKTVSLGTRADSWAITFTTRSGNNSYSYYNIPTGLANSLTRSSSDAMVCFLSYSRNIGLLTSILCRTLF